RRQAAVQVEVDPVAGGGSLDLVFRALDVGAVLVGGRRLLIGATVGEARAEAGAEALVGTGGEGGGRRVGGKARVVAFVAAGEVCSDEGEVVGGAGIETADVDADGVVAVVPSEADRGALRGALAIGGGGPVLDVVSRRGALGVDRGAQDRVACADSFDRLGADQWCAYCGGEGAIGRSGGPFCGGGEEAGVVGGV